MTRQRCATVTGVNVAVIGLGLIGGSLVRRLAAGGHRVVGFDADPATRATARTAAARAEPGARWQVAGTIRDAIAQAELTVLAVPLPALPSVLPALRGYGGLVTDVTSVKIPVRDAIDGPAADGIPDKAAADRTPNNMAADGIPDKAAADRGPAGQGLRFVGGHPMAGRETSGFGASDPALFDGCAWVLCLEEDTDLGDWLLLAGLVTELGARVVPATAAEHDRAVAAASHVPHLLAAALTVAVAGDPLAAALAAGSFRDGTRVAATRPDLVAAMCGGNAAAVGPALDAVLDALAQARAALDAADPIDALRSWLAPGSAARLAWPPRGGTPVRLPAQSDALLRLGRSGGWVTRVADDRRTVTAVTPAPRDPVGSPAAR
jgi:prephenate dehydrogenase